jgi:hypothetical protein
MENKMFSSVETEERWIGRIIKELNNGKTIGSILLECSSWTDRTRILLNVKKIEKCYSSFKRLVAETHEPPVMVTGNVE